MNSRQRPEKQKREEQKRTPIHWIVTAKNGQRVTVQAASYAAAMQSVNNAIHAAPVFDR
jgi:hypothetical protein